MMKTFYFVVLVLLPALTRSLPTSKNQQRLEELQHQLLNPEENAVDLDQSPEKATVEEAPITQDLFPDRQGFITGHRIPFELFSKETIKALKPTFTEESSYIDASDFRRNQQQQRSTTTTTEAPPTSPAVLLEPPIASPFAFHPQASGLSQEFDKAYFSTLDAFVHDF